MGVSPVRIRLAVLADLDGIASVHTQARSAYHRGLIPEEDLADPAAYQRRREIHRQRMQDPACTVLCAELDHELAGFALLGPPHEPAPDPRIVGQLRQIHVHPSRWRQGIGSALHRACIHAWQAASITTGRVDVWARNPRAQAFYAAQGLAARRAPPSRASGRRLPPANPRHPAEPSHMTASLDRHRPPGPATPAAHHPHHLSSDTASAHEVSDIPV